MSIIIRPNFETMNKEKAYKRLIKRQVQRSYSDSMAITNGEYFNGAGDGRVHRPLSLGTNSSDSRKHRKASENGSDRPAASASTLRRGMSLQDFSERVLTRPVTSIVGIRQANTDDQFPPIHDRRTQYVTLVPTKLQASSANGNGTDNQKSTDAGGGKQNGNVFPSASSIRKLLASDFNRKASAKQRVKFNSQDGFGIENLQATEANNRDATKSAKFYRIKTPKRNAKQVSFTDATAVDGDPIVVQMDTEEKRTLPPKIGGDSFALTERNLEIHSSFQLPKHKFVKTTENNSVTTKRLDERVLKWVEERNFSAKMACHDIPEMEDEVGMEGVPRKSPQDERDRNANLVKSKTVTIRQFLRGETHSDKNMTVSDTSTSKEGDAT